MDCKGQRILITGASSGIGHAIAAELLASGARLTLHYHSNREGAEALLQQYPDAGAGLCHADLANPTSAIALFDSALRDLGGLDALVVNAGIFEAQPIDGDPDTWFAGWKKTLAVNLDSAGILTYCALRHFSREGGGRIIYIGSRAAFRGETPEYLAYAASKGGLTSLAKSVARSFGKNGVKSFTLAPGFTRTAMAEAFIASYGESHVLDELALAELTRPEHIAPLVAFICSGKMDHATGCTIDLNAGSYMH